MKSSEATACPDRKPPDRFTPETVRQLIDALWTPDNMELAVSGDFEPAELEAAITTYLGTLPPPPEGHVRPWEIDRATKFSMRMAGKPGFDDSVRTNDDVSRSYAVMGFPTVNRWGKLDCDAVKIDLTANMLVPSTLKDGSPYDAKMHPNRVLSVASEIVTNVLFEEIRTKRGLVYGISFAIKPYKHTESGIASISFMPKVWTLASKTLHLKHSG
jgi:predicted Zn-dependent peptidase